MAGFGSTAWSELEDGAPPFVSIATWASDVDHVSTRFDRSVAVVRGENSPWRRGVRSTWSSVDFAGDAARTVVSSSLFSAVEARESGVMGASTALVCGSCSSACFSAPTACGPEPFFSAVTVPLLDSSGVIGLAAGMVRDRRWGMAGTTRERGRRACLCAGTGASATDGAMAVISAESNSAVKHGSSGSRYQQIRSVAN